MFQYRLELALEYLVELLSDIVVTFDFGQLLDAVNEKLKLLEDLSEDLDVLIIDWLVQEVIEAESTGNDQHQAFVKLAGDVEQNLVVVLKLEAVIFDIVNHSGLLLVEKFPNLKYIFEVITRHFIKVTL